MWNLVLMPSKYRLLIKMCINHNTFSLLDESAVNGALRVANVHFIRHARSKMK